MSRAAFDEADALLALLRDSNDWRTELGTIDAWCEDPSYWPVVKHLHAKLAVMPLDRSKPSYSSALEHIESVVALAPGLARARFAWELLLAPRGTSQERSNIPSMLAQNHPFSELSRFLSTRSTEPGFAARAAELIVECGLRKEPVAGEPIVLSVWRALEAQGHPLAWLPPERRPLERGVNLTRFDVQSRGWSGHDETRSLAPAAIDVDATLPALAQQTLTPGARAAVEKAFHGMLTQSNGRLALVILSSRSALAPSIGLVRALSGHFEPFLGERSLQSGVIAAESAVASLLGAPIQGGDYGGGLGHCYGRLAGWKALGALVGREPSDPFDAIERDVAASVWLSIAPTTAWFEKVMTDHCLVCLRPGRKSLSAIAWTDTD